MKYNLLFGISVLPALLIMPAVADTITARQVITSNTTYTDLTASNIASTVSNNGGVFYLQDVPNATLAFNGTTLFSGNSLNNGGMGGAIGNGWLSSTSGSGFTPGGKIVFNGDATFTSNSTNNPNGAGAIFNNGNGTVAAPDILFDGDATFTSNSATGASNSVYVGGGAIYHRDGAIVFNDGATFRNNKSTTRGGAIMSAGAMLFGDEVVFDGNTAELAGGAMAILGGNVTFADSAMFSNNTASSGAAIAISAADSVLSFQDSAQFIGNTGTGILVNNNTDSTVNFARGVVFDNNTNPLNGALVNIGTVNGTSGDFIFTNNTGSNGGGLKNSGTVTFNTTGDILFASNTTTSTAGALDNGGEIILDSSSVSFRDNVSNAGYGGAIFNAGDLQILGAVNTFSNNTANDSGAIKSGGGAVHNRGNTDGADLVIGASASTNTFSSNTSAAYGGALVSRAFDGAGQNSTVTVNGVTTFSNNKSALDGGAVWNMVAPADGTTGTSHITFNNDTSFINNTSGGMGGAIYNNDTVTFNGTTTFRGNTANGVANDIHNDGTVNFNGNATISGGITGSGNLNIASGKTLNIGTSTITQGKISLDGTMLATLRSGDTAQINVTNTDGFTGAGTLQLLFDAAGTYQVFGGAQFSSLDIGSSVYDLTWNGGAVTATLKSVADIASQNNLSNEAARTVVNVSQSTSPQLNNLSILMQEDLASGDNSAHTAIEHASRAISPETGSVAQSVGASTQNTLYRILTDRMAGGFGRNGGDVNVAPGDIWVQGYYNKSKLNDVFNGYTRGISAGFDGVINDVWTLGMGYMFGHSNIDAISRRTNVDSHSVFVYGQYKPSAWYMNAIVNYTMADYSEDGMAMGLNVTGDYDLDTFGANVAVGYDFWGGITPELSLRYMHMDSVDYSNSFGVRNKIDSGDFLTASLGTRYGFDMFFTNGWVVRPSMHYALRYDLMTDDNNINVMMPGINAYVLQGEHLSRVANEVGLELSMMYGAFNMSLNYDLEMRDNYTSQTGRVKFKYNF